MDDIMKFYRWGFLTEEETVNNLTQIIGIMSVPELQAELARVESECEADALRFLISRGGI